MQHNMEDKILNYRQPMVTATSLALGFTLNASGGWVANAFSTARVAEITLALGLCLHVPLYLIVLYRILNMDYPKNNVSSYYKKTLRYFIAGIVLSFLSIFVVLVESFIINQA